MEQLQKLRHLNERAERLRRAPQVEEPEEGELYLNGEKAGILAQWRERFKRQSAGAKPFPWKSLSVRNLLIAGCAVLILLAAYLNLRFVAEDPQKSLPQEPVGEGAESNALRADDDYFAIAVINRARARDEAIDMYQAVAEDEAASTASREAAYASMNALVDRTAAEIDIENAVKAKGFSQCVAILDNERATLIVECDTLSDAQVAQITEIVYLQADILPENLTITEKA